MSKARLTKNSRRKSRDRRLRLEQLEVRCLLAADSGAQNPIQPFDVNLDTFVTAFDALAGINYLNREGPGPLLEPTESGFLDVSGDGVMASGDILQVINRLNSGLPSLSARLVSDSAPGGGVNRDLVTNQYALAFGLSAGGSVADIQARVNPDATDPFRELSGFFEPGTLQLSEAGLDNFLGESLADGDHRFEIRLAGQEILDFILTVDTSAPQTPRFDLAPDSDTGILGDQTTALDEVAVLGQTDAQVSVELVGVASPTVSDTAGTFEFEGISLSPGDNSFTARAEDLAGNTSEFTRVILRAEENQPPDFPPLESLVATVGEPLEVELIASDPEESPVTFSLVQSDRLPSTLLDSNGRLTISPGPGDIGEYNFTVIASDGTLSVPQDVSLTVQSDALTTTRLSGVVLDVLERPLEGIPVALGETTTVTDAAGQFTLDFGKAPFPPERLEVRGTDFVGEASYPFVAEEIGLILNVGPFDNVNNVVARPIYLPELDTDGGSVIDPATDTTVTQEIYEGGFASVFVAAGSLLDQQGALYDGLLSITQVPPEKTPAALPPDMNPAVVVTIQPAEMVFTIPAPLTLPNARGATPGTVLDLWSINPETGNFDRVGEMQVSADGQRIETISGGIRNSSWHFPEPPLPEEEDPEEDERNEDDKSCECKLRTPKTSGVELHSGALTKSHELVKYQSLDEPRGFELQYDSQRADPQRILHFGLTGVPANSNQLMSARVILERGDVQSVTPGIGALEVVGAEAGDNFWTLPAAGGDIDAALQIDLRSQPTGRYTYTQFTGLRTLIEAPVRMTPDGPTTTSPAVTGSLSQASADFVSVNLVDSPFGAGWSLDAQRRLVTNPDGSIVLVHGDGSEAVFEPPSVDGEAFVSPPGDRSTLIREADGTFTRTFYDQTIEHYSETGEILSRTDRNGNVTTFEYDTDQRLLSITDPADLKTTFVWTGERVTSIVDPADRITLLTYDPDNNLIQITDPDGSSRRFDYDDQHRLTSETDKRGEEERINYGFHGRVESVTLTDGSQRIFEPLQVQGLYPFGSTFDPGNAPLAVVDDGPTATVTDENGNVTRYVLDKSGQLASAADDLGDLVTVTRDADNNIVSTTDGRGSTQLVSSDANGNVVSIADAESTPTSIVGTIETPGQIDSYPFTVTESGRRFYFDALTNDPAMRWALFDGLQDIVSNRGFTSSDGDNISAEQAVLDLRPGDYVLRVTAAGDATGDYSLRFLDIRTALPIVMGAENQTMVESPVETQLFNFDVTAGDLLYFDSIQNSIAGQWRAFDPRGDVLFDGSTATDRGPLLAPVTGRYTLLVEGDIRSSQAGSLTFAVHEVDPVDAPVGFGETVTGRIDHVGDVDRYTLSVDVPTVVQFDSLTPSFSTVWSLTGPSGDIVVDRQFVSSDEDSSEPLLFPGEYFVTVDSNRDLPESYSFRLLDYGAAPPVELDATVAVELSPGNSSTAFLLTGQAGDRFDIAVTGRTSLIAPQTTVRVLDPFGDQIAARDLPESLGEVHLPVAGDYVIAVDGDPRAVAPDFFTFEVQFVGNTPPDPFGGVPIDLGETIDAAIEAPGETDVYEFTLSDHTLVHFDALTNDSSLRFSIDDHQGNRETAGFTFDLGRSPVLLEPGEYVINVSDTSDDTPDYSFRLLDLQANSTDITDELGMPLQAQVAPGNSTQVVRFEADANDQIAFDAIEWTGAPGARWRLVDRFGASVFNDNLEDDRFEETLPTAGTYYLLVSGSISETSDQAFDYRIQPRVSETQTVDISAPLTIVGSIETPGEEVVYDFTVDESVALLFDPVSSERNVSYSVVATVPLGAVQPVVDVDGSPVEQRPFRSFSGLHPFFEIEDTIVQLDPGSYALKINAADLELDDNFEMRVTRVSDAAPVQLNAITDVVLSPQSERRMFRFDGNAGDRIYVDNIRGTGLRGTLLDPNLQPMFETFLNAFVDFPQALDVDDRLEDRTIELPAAGTYTLFYEGVEPVGEGDLSFAVYDSLVSTAALNLGDVITGSIDRPAEFDHFEFSLTDDARLYFDSRADSPDIAWTLNRGGEVVDRRALGDEDFAGEFLDLAAGDYTLAVFGRTGDSVGQYSFVLSEAYSGDGLALDVAAEVTVAGNQSVLRTFEAEAGDTVSFRETSRSGVPAPPRWRVIDPQGGVLFSEVFDATSDPGEITLPHTGTYAIVFESEVAKVDTETLAFLVERISQSPPPVDVSVPLVLNTPVDGNLTVAGQPDLYRFTVTDTTWAYVDLAFGGEDDLRLSLTGPRGTIINDRSFNNGDFGFRPERLTPGDYLLEVRGRNDHTGSYRFSVFDLYAGDPVSLGETVNGELSPAFETDLFMLELAEGQELFFDTQVSRPSDRWRLFDPYGQVAFDESLIQDRAIVAQHAGQYALLIEGNRDPVEQPYEFAVYSRAGGTEEIRPPASFGVRFDYDPQFGQPISRTDELGNVTLFTLDANGNRISSINVVGEVGGDDDVVRTFSYTDRGLLETATDPLGRVTRYAYDSQGRTTSIIYAEGTADEAIERFEYDNAGNVTARVDLNGNRTEYVYDARNRVVTVRDALENESSFTYDADGNVLRATDELGNTTEQAYDQRGRLISSTDALGNTTFFEYDQVGNLIRETDGSGRVVRYEYDSRNRRIASIDAAGNQERFVWDAADNLVELADRAGLVTSYVFDERNRLVETTDPLGGTASFAYDAEDNLLVETDELGRITTHTYDSLNRRIVSRDPLGEVTRFKYDKVGNQIEVVDPLGRMTQVEFDDRDRPVLYRDALGTIQSSVFNGEGNVTRLANGAGEATVYEYDALNRLVLERDRVGNEQTREYDATDNLIRATDFEGNSTEFTWDAVDRLVSRKSSLDQVTNYTYDGAGRQLTETDALGNTTSYEYDSVGRLVRRSNPDGTFVLSTYDAVGNVTSITDEAGNATAYVYDALDRLITRSNALESPSTYVYDAVGNLIGTTDAAGRERAFVFDTVDRVTAERWLDDQGAIVRELRYDYDAAGQLIQAGDPDASYTFEYDERGRRVAEHVSGAAPDVRLEFAYDAADRLLSVTDHTQSVETGVTAYEWDPLDRLIGISQSGPQAADKRVDLTYHPSSLLASVSRFSDLAGTQQVAETVYTYDAADRLTRIAHTRGPATLASFDYSYDAADRITQVVDLDGTVDLTYDALGQLTDAVFSDDRADEFYRYDDNGNRSSSHLHADAYQSEVDNRLTTDGTFDYSWDEAGNLISRQNAATGEFREFEYDHRGRLVRVIDRASSGGAETQEVVYRYDIFDRRIAKTVDLDGEGPAVATTTHFVYHQDNVLLDFADTDGPGGAPPTLRTRYLFGSGMDSILAQEDVATGEVMWLLTNAQGSVTDLVDSSGVVVNHIQYDSFGNIASQSNAEASTRYLFTSREFEVETGLYYFRARYYEPRLGRFISQDPEHFAAGDTNLYRYVSNSPYNGIDPTGREEDSFLERNRKNKMQLDKNVSVLRNHVKWWVKEEARRRRLPPGERAANGKTTRELVLDARRTIQFLRKRIDKELRDFLKEAERLRKQCEKVNRSEFRKRTRGDDLSTSDRIDRRFRRDGTKKIEGDSTRDFVKEGKGGRSLAELFLPDSPRQPGPAQEKQAETASPQPQSDSSSSEPDDDRDIAADQVEHVVVLA